MIDSATYEAFEDVAFTTATPFTDDLATIDHAALAENLAWLEDAGARLFIACGNTGEYYALTEEERINVVQTHVEVVSAKSTVVGGAGGSLKTVAALSAEYESAGADAVMVMNPAFVYSHRDGLLEYYRSIAEATSLDVVLYKRGPALPDAVIAELTTIENVVAVKYAMNDIAAFSSIVRDSPGTVTWVNGIAERFAPSFHVEGATGFTTGLGNFAPKASLTLQESLQMEDYSRARELRDVLAPVESLRQESGTDPTLRAANNVPVVKYGLELAGLTGGPCRPPIVELTDADADRLERYYHDIENALS